MKNIVMENFLYNILYVLGFLSKYSHFHKVLIVNCILYKMALNGNIVHTTGCRCMNYKSTNVEIPLTVCCMNSQHCSVYMDLNSYGDTYRCLACAAPVFSFYKLVVHGDRGAVISPKQLSRALRLFLSAPHGLYSMLILCLAFTIADPLRLILFTTTTGITSP